ncbi:MAG: OmpH family outer membrane protein, partial [Bacteroidia bacterium]|nr:OmpH family outer membrane protein [Bacteroidia bacterium]
MRTFFILIILGCFSVASYAQAPAVQKIGYADWDFIFSQLPEYKQIDSELKIFGTQLENQLKSKYQDYET